MQENKKFLKILSILHVHEQKCLGLKCWNGKLYREIEL